MPIKPTTKIEQLSMDLLLAQRLLEDARKAVKTAQTALEEAAKDERNFGPLPAEEEPIKPSDNMDPKRIIAKIDGAGVPLYVELEGELESPVLGFHHPFPLTMEDKRCFMVPVTRDFADWCDSKTGGWSHDHFYILLKTKDDVVEARILTGREVGRLVD